jgi:uncharacterized membrane protein (UPF0136 family)
MLFLIVAIAPMGALALCRVVLAGGVMGYVKARSKPSLISGLISGAALLIAWWITLSNSYNAGIALATCLAIALLIVSACASANQQIHACRINGDCESVLCSSVWRCFGRLNLNSRSGSTPVE